MKKLAIAGAIIALSSSAFSADESFYVTGGGMLTLAQGTEHKIEIEGITKDNRSEYGYGVKVGIGYHIMDNVRAEVNLSWFPGIEYHGKKVGEHTPKISLDGFTGMLNAYVDVISFGPAKLYVGGGAGASYFGGSVEESKNKADQKAYDKALGFAYQGVAGLSFDVANNVGLDLDYRLTGVVLPGNNSDDQQKTWAKEVAETSPWIHSFNLGIRFSL